MIKTIEGKHYQMIHERKMVWQILIGKNAKVTCTWIIDVNVDEKIPHLFHLKKTRLMKLNQRPYLIHFHQSGRTRILQIHLPKK
jgi:hypothetical protein